MLVLIARYICSVYNVERVKFPIIKRGELWHLNVHIAVPVLLGLAAPALIAPTDFTFTVPTKTTVLIVVPALTVMDASKHPPGNTDTVREG